MKTRLRLLMFVAIFPLVVGSARTAAAQEWGAQPWGDFQNIYGVPVEFTTGGIDEQHHIYTYPASDESPNDCYYRLRNRYAQKLTVGVRVFLKAGYQGRIYEDSAMKVEANALSSSSGYHKAEDIDHLTVLSLMDESGHYLFGGPNQPAMTPPAGDTIVIPPPTGQGPPKKIPLPKPTVTIPGVSSYQTYVGSAPGAADYFTGPQQPGALTEMPPENMPTDGRRIYLRFNYLQNGVWRYYDFIYHAPKSGPNQPPTVSLTSTPANAVAPATVSLTASAADSDGTIAKVELFQNGTTSYGAKTAAPFTWTFSNLAAGVYGNWTAVATDNRGATTRSAVASFTVGNGTVTLPVITTQPQSQLIAEGQNVTFSVQATGANLTYLWRKVVVNGESDVRSSATKGSSVTITNVSLLDAGKYVVYVTNSAGTVRSAEAQLTTFTPNTLPDLTFGQPAGWSSKLVVANTQNATADTPLRPTDTLYLNWDVLNIDTVVQAPAGQLTPISVQVRVDGVSYDYYSTFDPLGPGADRPFRNIAIGSLPAGNHTLELILDPVGFVSEHNESNNTYTRTITVRGAPKDFNGDGTSDIVWENTLTGRRDLWTIRDGKQYQVSTISTVPVEWRITGAGDFDGDGHPDILWENTRTGQRDLWLMNGIGRLQTVTLAQVSVDWRIGAVGDFDGDGKVDIVWNNTKTGACDIWLMNGLTRGKINHMDTIPVSWRIAAAGDLDGDGTSDILWQDSVSGRRNVWTMRNGAVVRTTKLADVSTEWLIVGAGDFNGDGQCDLVWQNTRSGRRDLWMLDKGVLKTVTTLTTVPVEWSIADH